MMSKPISNVVCFPLSIVCGFIAVVAYSVPRTAAAQSGPPSIPREAYAACESKAEGDECTVHFCDNQLKGTCVKEPSGSRLVCRPNDMPPPPR